MQFTWLHLSDIHFHFSSYESMRLREEFLKKIKEISTNTKIDYLFLSGDLADKNGNYSENLIDYLNDVTHAIGIIKDNVIIVPGNHDHDRIISQDVLNGIYEGYDQSSSNKINESVINRKIDSISIENLKILENSFSIFNTICSNYYGSEKTYSSHSIVKHTDEDPIIARINTCMFDRSSNDEKKELHIGMKQLLESLNDQDIESSELNIAIGHHPTSVLCNEEKNRFLDFLQSRKFSLYLCGHKHKPEFIYHSDYDVYEIICGYGNSDDYSKGGFSIGHIDTIQKQYYVDYYNWMYQDRWVKDTNIQHCNETGRCYLEGEKLKSIAISQVVVPIKLYGPPITSQEIISVVGSTYELFPYLSESIIDVRELDWEKEIKKITEFVHLLHGFNNKHVNIFPIAPIPLLVCLGFQLQNNSNISIFQYDRENSRWTGSITDKCPSYNLNWKKKLKNASSEKLVIQICTSTMIFDKQLPKFNKTDYIELSLENKEIGFPLYRNHYKEMLNCLFNEITPSIAQYNEIHLFASIPAGMAIELGRRVQKGIFPKVFLYNYCQNQYTLTNVINE